MKRLALLSVTALALAACSATNTDSQARYELEIRNLQGDRVEQVTEAAERVVERVADSMDQEISSKRLRKTGDNYVLYVSLKDPQATPILTELLTAGFRFRLMQESAVADADVTAKLQSGDIGFKETGITEKELSWVDVQSVTTTDGQGKSTEMGQVTIELTPSGKELFQRVQRENVNKTLGIYVRDRLVSTMRVAPNQASDSIVISNVPSTDIANVFADDVNVGLHVTFQPQGAALPATATGQTVPASSSSAAGSR